MCSYSLNDAPCIYSTIDLYIHKPLRTDSGRNSAFSSNTCTQTVWYRYIAILQRFYTVYSVSRISGVPSAWCTWFPVQLSVDSGVFSIIYCLYCNSSPLFFMSLVSRVSGVSRIVAVAIGSIGRGTKFYILYILVYCFCVPADGLSLMVCVLLNVQKTTRLRSVAIILAKIWKITHRAYITSPQYRYDC